MCDEAGNRDKEAKAGKAGAASVGTGRKRVSDEATHADSHCQPRTTMKRVVISSVRRMVRVCGVCGCVDVWVSGDEQGTVSC